MPSSLLRHARDLLAMAQVPRLRQPCRLLQRAGLVEQVTGRVRWRESMEWMGTEGGVTRFVEIGSGTVIGPQAVIGPDVRVGRDCSIGAQVSVVTMSGSNALHGSLFEFIRNNKLDARNFFDRQQTSGDPRLPPFRRNQFGATLSGPDVQGA